MIRPFLYRTRPRSSLSPSFLVSGDLLVIPHQNIALGTRLKSSKSRKHGKRDTARGNQLSFEQREKRKRGLHAASKWKRILSQCDYWFSNRNLVEDELLKDELRKNDGWCRIETLLTFPKLKHWATAQNMVDAFHAVKRFQLKNADNNPRKALVRKRGITVDHLEIIAANQELYLNREKGNVDESSAKPKQKCLPKYRSHKKIIVIRNPNQLPGLCDNIRQSINKSVGDYNTTDASVLGLDVEFATLELDIRPTLPAMMQLSAPDGPVGLIWLDKLPDHGRGVLHDPVYAPLTNLLVDPTIVKVGMSIHSDAKYLAAWWGINDNDYVQHFFSNLQDLRDMPELSDCFTGNDEKTGLVAACATVLKKGLRKRKTTEKNRKISHWRAPELTTDMKQYAANDASVAVDVWMALKVGRKHNNRDHRVVSNT